MIDGHGGIVIGSEMSAGVRNVYAQNCIMNSPELDRAVRLKTNTLRGGFVDGLFVRNIKVGQVKECVLRIEMNYSVYKGQDKGDFIPKIKNIYLDNFEVRDSGKYVIWAEGLDNSFIENVNIKNFNVKTVKDNFKLKNIDIKFYNTNIKNNKITN
jgi:polygalacturonase